MFTIAIGYKYGERHNPLHTNNKEQHAEDMEVQGNEGGRTPTMAEAAERKDINDWLPITKSRNAKWWYSAFHNVTAVVGAGVLGFPYAMSELGWFVHHIFFPLNF